MQNIIYLFEILMKNMLVMYYKAAYMHFKIKTDIISFMSVFMQRLRKVYNCNIKEH